MLMGCSQVELEGLDAQGYKWQKDGATGIPVFHRDIDIFLNCGLEPDAKSCSIIRDGICDVYLPPNAPSWMEAHELKHCAGWRHPDPMRWK